MKRVAATLCAALLAAVFLGCPSQYVAPPSPVVPTDMGWCKSGCDHLLLLKGRDGNPGCEEARVLELPGGEIVTCEQFCKDTEKAGRNLYPSCWTKVARCEEIEKYRLQAKSCE